MTERQGRDSPEFSLWLLPEPGMAQRLDALISRLAPLFGCPVFQAHLTVQGDLAGSRAGLEEILRTVALMPIGFELTGVGASSAYFRSLYLDFRHQPDFSLLQREVAARTGTEVGLAPFPHLSLAYGEPADPAKKDCLRNDAELAALAGTIRFDRLALVRSSKDVPIEQWTPIQVRQLG